MGGIGRMAGNEALNDTRNDGGFVTAKYQPPYNSGVSNSRRI